MPVDMIYWDHYSNAILFLNLLIVISLFACLRLFSGALSRVHASYELLKKDNPAFGISLSAAAMGVAIMLSGTIYGDLEETALRSIVSVGVFGLFGIVLLAVTRMIFDRFTLPAVSLRDEVVSGNVAVAIADAGNIIASALILRAVIVWVTVYSFEGFIAVLCAFALSQALLTIMTIARIRMFGRISRGNCLQKELRERNTALALRFSGLKIGAAFAITTAAQIVVYEEYDLVNILGAWLAASIVIIAVWKALCLIAERIILFRVDTNQEVIDQRNVALGAFQAAISIALGFLLSTL